VIADQHGNVVGRRHPRLASLQRRFQKLVEEAPAPFLNRCAAQGKSTSRPSGSAREAGYYGGRHRRVPGRPRDGLISFPRGQYATAGRATRLTGGRTARLCVDLPGCCKQFNIAKWREARTSPKTRPRGAGHAIRVSESTAEDAGPAASWPAPGPVTKFEPPRADPGRFDWTPGVVTGSVIGGPVRLDAGQVDRSTGATRQGGAGPGHAGARSTSFHVEGALATVIPVPPGDRVPTPAFIGGPAKGLHRAHPLDRNGG